MPKRRATPDVLDTIARITGDIATDKDSLARLRSLLAATAHHGATPLIGTRADLDVPPSVRRDIAETRPDSTGGRNTPLLSARRDLREDLLAGRIAGPLSGLGGAERIGPFTVDDSAVFFDFWRPARRLEITEQGATAPAFVISSARKPRRRIGQGLTLDLQKGTVWLRGDLVDAGLPAGAYVGITLRDGTLRLPAVVAETASTLQIAAPLTAELHLILDAETLAPAEDGCQSGVVLDLPAITLTFGPTGMSVAGQPGSARVWGQTFRFDAPNGTTTFVPQLWTLLLGYGVEDSQLNAGHIRSALADFTGLATVTSAALALPVVVAPAAALGPAAVSPGFWLALNGVQARWYATDPRLHRLDPWLALSNRGTALLDTGVAPLDPAVETTYRLWSLPGSEGKRLPWRHDYREDFLFFHTCDVQLGESLTITGQAKVALDRPLAANGNPVATPTTGGTVHLTSNSHGLRVVLAASVQGAADTRLVLRNALIWATGTDLLFAEGRLTDRHLLDQGALAIRFGLLSWTPSLPDPYVGNFHICRPEGSRPRALIAALLRWSDPDNVSLSFSGDMGLPTVCPNDRSDGASIAAPRSDQNPDIGLTQTEQGRLHLSRSKAAEYEKARAQDKKLRDKRLRGAIKTNAEAQRHLDRHLTERLGPTPPVFLLDVSTHQDLLGVALWAAPTRRQVGRTAGQVTAPPDQGFALRHLDVMTDMASVRLVTLPQVQWEPVRTLDEDQDVLTLGWFPTPLASASDGGATILGARSQKLAPVAPGPILTTTKEVFDSGTEVTFRTTLPFGLVAVAHVAPTATPTRHADSLDLTQPEFGTAPMRGGLQITAKAQGGQAATGAASPHFEGTTRQLINGVDLASGAPLGVSVLSSTGDPAGDVESIFNTDMATNPKVPVTRFDLSGYGGSNFSTWEDPFALFATTAKTQFQVTLGRTALEIIKVASVLHPWGIKVTRSVIVERRSGGGVIRRDTGWKATSNGMFDYRYVMGGAITLADYAFDSGIFKGLFDIRAIRPAPGVEVAADGATFVPYYFDADVALDGLTGRVPANGVLGWLQTAPSGTPASAAALHALITAQGAPGGPLDAWVDFGASRLPFRARRIEVDSLIDPTGKPLFVATIRGVPKLPNTGAWSVVRRPLTGLAEALPVSDSKGVPIIRRHAVRYPATTAAVAAPPRDPTVPIGSWRMADPTDLLAPDAPQHDYALLQSTPTHAFLFPRPVAANSGAARVTSTVAPQLADIFARSTSKAAFPPPENAITLPSALHFDVGPGGSLALPSPISVVNHPTPLRLAGSPGHGTEISYQDSSLHLTLAADRWAADFVGVTLYSGIAGLDRATGARMRVVGSTDQRPQVATIDTLVYEPVETILTYIPVFGARDSLGPIDLGASNAKHEFKIVIEAIQDVPRYEFSIGGAKVKLRLAAGGSTGWDLATGAATNSGDLFAGLKAEFPLATVGVAKVYIVVLLEVKFAITSSLGVVTEEKLELVAFVGIGVKGEIGPFEAYAYLGIGFVFVYDFVAGKPKFGGLVRFEAGIDLGVAKVKLLAELKGVVYTAVEALPPPGTGSALRTKCDFTGKVKLQVELFLIISISATYTVSDTATLN